MKVLHAYGISALLLIVGALLWLVQAQLIILAWCSISAGALWFVGSLWKHYMPAIETTVKTRLVVEAQEYEQWSRTVDKQIELEWMRYAIRTNKDMEKHEHGGLTIKAPARVQVVEDRSNITPPQSQLALPAPRQDECLNLSPGFQPHANTILSQRGMIVGISGSGKSNSVATLHEELGRLLVPFLLIDTEGEYGSLCTSQYLPRGQKFDSSQVVSANAKDFGWNIIENHMQAVLDVTSYEPDEAAMVVVNTLAGLQEWEEELENDDRLSFMITLSEAGAWFPQSSNAIPYSAQAYKELQTSFFTNLVPRGRKRGLGLIFDLQRPAQVDKRLMQTSWKILHRQTESRDIEIYKTLAGLEREEVVSLGDGEAYIFSSQVSKQRVQIRKRYTQHEANTPGLESIRRRQYALPDLGNFGRNFGISETPRNDFDERVRPFRKPSEYNIAEIKSQARGIPEGTKQAIIDLYRDGKKRTEIQDQLDINGDEYWMIKQACDEYDQQARRA